MENKESLMLERAYMFLEEKKWVQANEYCDKILDENPRNANAHLIKLLADCQVVKKEDLHTANKNFSENINYKRVLQYGETNLVIELQKQATRQEDTLRKQKEEVRQKRGERIEIIITTIFLGIAVSILAIPIFICVHTWLPYLRLSILVGLLISFLIGIVFPLAYSVEKYGERTKEKVKRCALINTGVIFVVLGVFLFFYNFVECYCIVEKTLISFSAEWFVLSVICMPLNYLIGKSIMTKKQKGEK